METVAEFKECPDCGGSVWLAYEMVQEEIAYGRMSKDVLACSGADIIYIIDPTHPPISGGRIPAARVLRDICKKCGKTQTVRIDKGHVTIPTIQGMPPTFS